MKPFISLCMIVKNEQSVLKRCLQSVEGIVDEIVIVDTGSTDLTKVIASQYTNNIFHFEWINDFSAARNYAASKAKGDWIVVLDADEYVDRENLIVTISYLKSAPIDLYIYKTNIINFAGEHGDQLIQHQHNRIYRNIPSVKFHRKVHEQLMKDDKSVNGAESPLTIYHSGYMKHVVKEKNKGVRNRKLIEEELQKTDNVAFDYFNLGNELNSIGEYQKALNCYQKAFNLKKDIHYAWVPINIVQLIHCLIFLQRYQDALNVIEDAKKIWTDAIDFHYLQGHIYFLQNRFDDAKLVLNDLLSENTTYKKTLVSLNYKDIYPYNTLGKIAKLEREEYLAVEYYSKSLGLNKYQQEILLELIQILVRYHDESEVEDYLNKLGLNKDNYQVLNTIRVLLQVPELNIAKKYSEYILETPVIKDGVNLKSQLINGDITEVLSKLTIMPIKDVQLLLEQHIIDAYDLLIILLQVQGSTYEILTQKLFSSDNRFIVSILNGEKVKEEFMAYFTLLLDRCIRYNYFDTFEKLLQLRDVTLIPLTLNIGHLLYSHDFKEIAIGFYQEINHIESYDDETILNIIKEFMNQEELDSALNYVISGIEQGRSDFRTFKLGIELAERKDLSDLKKELVKIALEIYPDSRLLKNYL